MEIPCNNTAYAHAGLMHICMHVQIVCKYDCIWERILSGQTQFTCRYSLGWHNLLAMHGVMWSTMTSASGL